jgi:hypothetical protein
VIFSSFLSLLKLLLEPYGTERQVWLDGYVNGSDQHGSSSLASSLARRFPGGHDFARAGTFQSDAMRMESSRESGTTATTTTSTVKPRRVSDANVLRVDGRAFEVVTGKMFYTRPGVETGFPKVPK